MESLGKIKTFDSFLFSLSLSLFLSMNMCLFAVRRLLFVSHFWTVQKEVFPQYCNSFCVKCYVVRRYKWYADLFQLKLDSSWCGCIDAKILFGEGQKISQQCHYFVCLIFSYQFSLPHMICLHFNSCKSCCFMLCRWHFYLVRLCHIDLLYTSDAWLEKYSVKFA